MVLVIASTLLEFFEEFRSNQAAEKLKQLVATTTTVLRDGKETEIPIKDITLGDIVILSAGSGISTSIYTDSSSRAVTKRKLLLHTKLAMLPTVIW